MKLYAVVLGLFLTFFDNGSWADDSEDSLVYSSEQRDALNVILSLDLPKELANRELTEFRISCFVQTETLSSEKCQSDHVVHAITVILPLMTDELCRSCGRAERAQAVSMIKLLKRDYTSGYYDLVRIYNECKEEPELIALLPDIQPPPGFCT